MASVELNQRKNNDAECGDMGYVLFEKFPSMVEGAGAAPELICEVLVDEKVDPEDVIDFSANLSCLTSKKLVNILHVLEKQLLSKSHPINVLARNFATVMIAHLKQKESLIDLLLQNPSNSMEELFKRQHYEKQK